MKKITLILIAVFISIAVNAQSNTNTYRYPLILGIRATAPITGGALILNGLTSGSATIQVPAIAGTGTIFQLPATNGTSGYVLRTDGAGVLTWVKPEVAVSDTAAMLSKYSLKLNATFTGTHNLYGGVTVGPFATANKATITSAILTGTTVALYNGATQYSVGVAPADQVTGVAVVDTTGNAPGNYMTRQNYHNDMDKSSVLKALQGFGVGIKAMPVSVIYASGALTLTDARALYVLVYIPETTVVTGVKWIANTLGKFLADSVAGAFNGFALYKCDAAGTTHTRVAITADNAGVWRLAATVVGTAAFTGTYTAEPGYYFVASLWNHISSTTSPKVYSSDGVINLVTNSLITANKYISGYVGSQATFPANETGADMTVNSNIPYYILY
jgi:hypothetical protein